MDYTESLYRCSLLIGIWHGVCCKIPHKKPRGEKLEDASPTNTIKTRIDHIFLMIDSNESDFLDDIDQNVRDEYKKMYADVRDEYNFWVSAGEQQVMAVDLLIKLTKLTQFIAVITAKRAGFEV